MNLFGEKDIPNNAVCGQLVGSYEGRLCEACEGMCPICRSEELSDVILQLCDDCQENLRDIRCCRCGKTPAKAKAFVCQECMCLERHRRGCQCPTNIDVQVDETLIKKSE
eukprot:gnl/Chilomastix_caulleri/918.p1 GENE.gnl/Chilomastix_caulleri/918~~gnl/Chilomastix_caulleri/918.p1  ORF type:complete len:110 (+),score=18.30 gnl/Chilomastix_caulleri/918:11-340(+)